MSSEELRQQLLRAYNQQKMQKILSMQRDMQRPLETIKGLVSLYNYENPASQVNEHIIRGIKIGVNLIDREMTDILESTEELDRQFWKKMGT
jgi:hypothetical protein